MLRKKNCAVKLQSNYNFHVLSYKSIILSIFKINNSEGLILGVIKYYFTFRLFLDFNETALKLHLNVKDYCKLMGFINILLNFSQNLYCVSGEEHFRVIFIFNTSVTRS